MGRERTTAGFTYLLSIFFCVSLFDSVLYAQADELSSTERLKKLSVEDLMEIEVTSVFKRTETLFNSPTSLYVITAEDIRRSGASMIPEILRLAPNLQVAQIDPVQYAISARGFNNAVGNKLLVLIDGRTIYTPLFSGVFWEQQDLMVEDIDRIEVISGPGATLWGANAVNGVINIITKRAGETIGGLVTGGAGDHDRGFAVRYGDSIGSNAEYRLYGKFWDWDNFENVDGAEQLNDWYRAQAGFRLDWRRNEDNFTIQGDAYTGESEHRGFVGNLEITELTISGANLLSRWTRQLSVTSEMQLQVYYDHSERDDIILFRPNAEIFDIDFQHQIQHEKHQIVWGAGYRRASDEVKTGLLFTFFPAEDSLNWGNFFIQDEITLKPEISLTVGLKLEHNKYTGIEYLPSARVSYKVLDHQLLWGAISRAVRAPSRLDRDIFFPANPPFIVAGGPNFESEVANVYEVGYRSQPLDDVGFSITFFAHDWDQLRSGTAPPVLLENKIEGWVYGAETWGNFQVVNACSLKGGFTYLREDLELEPDSGDPVGIDNPNLRNDPEHFWRIGSQCDLTKNLEFDLDLRQVGALPFPPLDGYTELNLRLAWQLRDDLEIAVIGRNLLHDGHPEFGTNLPTRNAVERSFLAKLTWSF